MRSQSRVRVPCVTVSEDRFLVNQRDPSGGDPNSVIIKDITAAFNCAVTSGSLANTAGFVAGTGPGYREVAYRIAEEYQLSGVEAVVLDVDGGAVAEREIVARRHEVPVGADDAGRAEPGAASWSAAPGRAWRSRPTACGAFARRS